MTWLKQNWVKVFLIIFICSFFLIPSYSLKAASYKGFVVEEVIGSDKLLITDGYSHYLITYSFFGCSSWDFYSGKVIYIDTYFAPSLFDEILVEGFSGTKTCDIGSSEEVDLEKYYVDSVIDSKDSIIVVDKYGTKRLVEYGIGCLSMWRYEGKNIDIDVGGSFLDGIGDTIYLFDSDDECRVWDAEEFNTSYPLSYYTPQYTPASLPSCPANSTRVNGTCTCNSGYTSNSAKDGCITLTQSCQNSYGSNVFAKDGLCYCKDGYQWNNERTACYVILTPPPTPIKTPVPTPTLTPKVVIATSTPVTSIPEPKISQTENKTERETITEGITFSLFGRELLRECPGKECGVVRGGLKGDIVELIETGKDWYKVATYRGEDKKEGYMHSSLIPENTKAEFSSLLEERAKEALEKSEDNKPNFIVRFFKWLF